VSPYSISPFGLERDSIKGGMIGPTLVMCKALHRDNRKPGVKRFRKALENSTYKLVVPYRKKYYTEKATRRKKRTEK